MALEWHIEFFDESLSPAEKIRKLEEITRQFGKVDANVALCASHGVTGAKYILRKLGRERRVSATKIGEENKKNGWDKEFENMEKDHSNRLK